MKRFFKGLWNFLKGVLLLILSLVLFIVLAPWGLIEILIQIFWRKKFVKGLSIFGEIILTIAILIDVLGNVILQVPLNRIFNTNSGYRFGSRFDTISYVLGYGLVHNTLSERGRKFVYFLDFFEKDHCIKAYYKRNLKKDNG